MAELRSPRRLGWINRFLQEYALGTDEGLALLGLAEAFLRVPDAYTASELIHDKVGDSALVPVRIGFRPVDGVRIYLSTRVLIDIVRVGLAPCGGIVHE